MLNKFKNYLMENADFFANALTLISGGNFIHYER